MNKIGPRLKRYFLLITYAILLYLAVQYQIGMVFLVLFMVLSPFILGIIFAYVLNIMVFLNDICLIDWKEQKTLFEKTTTAFINTNYLILVFLFLTIISLFMVPIN